MLMREEAVMSHAITVLPEFVYPVGFCWHGNYGFNNLLTTILYQVARQARSGCHNKRLRS
jgi:hypothetical protein